MTALKDIDSYISRFPADTQKILKRIRKVIAGCAPDLEEAMAYGIPTFKLNGNLVHFAGYRSHIGFYPSPSGVKAFKKDLKGFKSARGSIQFPLDKPIPYALIKKIVRFRIKENLGLKQKIT